MTRWMDVGDGHWCYCDMAFPQKNDTKLILSVTPVRYLDYRSSLGEAWQSDCIKTIKFKPMSL